MTNSHRILNLILGLSLLGLSMGLLSHTPAQATRPSSSYPSWVTRPCLTEDDTNCHWDAQSRGNGEGHSFIVRLVPGKAGMICVFYAEPRYARTHDYCS